MPSPDPLELEPVSGPARPLSLAEALLPLVAMLVLLAAGAAFLDAGNELLVLVMLGAAAVAGAVAARVGRSWDDIQRATGEKLAAVLPAILILLSIGMLIGTWILSGTIPMLVYSGLHLVNPQYLVVTAFLATAVMSLCTGTSWGSAGTIGVALMGMADAVGLPPQALRLLADIDRVYVLGALTLLPPAFVVIGIVRKVPPALAMAASSVAAVLLGVLLQGFAVGDALVAMVGGFDLEMTTSLGLDPGSFSDSFRTLVDRGGLDSMTGTLLVVIAAFLLVGALTASGALDLMIRRLLKAVRSTFGLIAATMAAGGTMIALTSHGGVTALVIGGLFQKAYRDRGLAPENLSRTLEDSVTLVEPLMPWTVSAVFMATTLGVSTLDYLPWAFFCIGGPVFSLLLAATFERTRFGLRMV